MRSKGTGRYQNNIEFVSEGEPKEGSPFIFYKCIIADMIHPPFAPQSFIS